LIVSNPTKRLRAGGHGLFEEIRHEYRVHGAGCLPQTSHAAHAVEQTRRKSAIAEQMVVQKVQMPARQPLDLGQRGVDRLRVETLSAFEKRLLVAEVADVRTAARHDNRVRNQIERTLDQIASNRRDALERPDL
jgi:hypothetical protein